MTSLSQREVARLFRGPEGTAVTLAVDRRLPWPYLVKERLVIRLIRSAIATDCQNHGGSGDMNTKPLASESSSGVRRSSLLGAVSRQFKEGDSSASPISGGGGLQVSHETRRRSRSSLGASNGPEWGSPLSASGPAAALQTALFFEDFVSPPASGPSPCPYNMGTAAVDNIAASMSAGNGHKQNSTKRTQLVLELGLCGELMVADLC